jgi:predicted small lipoprotein YifL
VVHKGIEGQMLSQVKSVKLRVRAARAALPALTALALAACGNSGPVEIGPKGLHCVDDSQGCVSERGAALKQLVDDKGKSWIREPAPPAAYASGVRLFAYKQRKRELSCDELAIGRKEADAGPAVLRGPFGKNLSTAQVSRGVMLAQEISRELGNEMKRRCGRA